MPHSNDPNPRNDAACDPEKVEGVYKAPTISLPDNPEVPLPGTGFDVSGFSNCTTVNITIIDLSTGTTLATATATVVDGYYCHTFTISGNYSNVSIMAACGNNPIASTTISGYSISNSK